MKLTNKPKHMDNIRVVAVNPEDTVPPDGSNQVQIPVLNKPIGPSSNNPFHPGDIVIFNFNQKGTVISVEGDGVQVDFGLGVHYLSYQVLKLSQNEAQDFIRSFPRDFGKACKWQK